MNLRKAIIAGPVYLRMTTDPASTEMQFVEEPFKPDDVFDAQGVAFGIDGKAVETGLNLYRLKIPTRLVGKVGDDRLGAEVLRCLREISPELAEGIVLDLSVKTGAIVQSNPANPDHVSPGANKLFYASDMPRADLQTADLFHFADPASMRSVYRGEGGELFSILQRARREGLTTSLDFYLPESTGDFSRVDWSLVLENCLRNVDLFFVDGADLVRLFQPEDFIGEFTPELLDKLTGQIISTGVKILLVRLGAQGLYLRTAPAPAWKKAGRALDGFGETWHDQTLWVPGVNGSAIGGPGALVAGFLGSLLRGQEPETALLTACATQVTSSENTWESLQAQLDEGWAELPLAVSDENWRKEGPHGLWRKG